MSIRRTIKVLLGRPRMIKYRLLRGNRIGKGTWIGKNAFLSKCDIGKYVFMGGNCVINYASIGNYSSIAPAVQIGGMEHDYRGLTTCAHLSDQQLYGSKTIIKEDVWIGAACIIKQGVTIGRGAVVGANSFVTKDVPPYAVVYGTPARLIKYRFSEDTMRKLESSKYWELELKEARQVISNIKRELENDDKWEA